MGQKFQPPIDLSPVSEKKTRWVMGLSMLSFTPNDVSLYHHTFFPIEFMPYDHHQSFHRCPTLVPSFFPMDFCSGRFFPWIFPSFFPYFSYFGHGFFPIFFMAKNTGRLWSGSWRWPGAVAEMRWDFSARNGGGVTMENIWQCVKTLYPWWTSK